MANKLQIRRDSLANWEAANPIIADGELIYISTLGNRVYDKEKVGDGVKTFTQLPYKSTGGTSEVVTTTTNGLMIAADKVKLDGIAPNANNYVHPTNDGNLHVPATGTTNNGKVLMAGPSAGSLLWSNIVSQDNSITNLKLSQVPTATIKGRASSGTGDVEDLTAAQALAVIGAKSATYQGEFKTAIVTMGTGAQSYQLPKSTISYFDAPMPTNATMLFKIDATNTANPAQVLTNELFQSVVYIQTGADITGVSFTYPNGQMIFGTFIMQSSTTYKFTWDAIRVNGTTVKIYLTITKV